MPLAANEKKLLHAVTPLLCERVHPHDILFRLTEIITPDNQAAISDIESTTDSKGKEKGMYHLLRHYESIAENLLPLQLALAHYEVDINKLVEEKHETEQELLETIQKFPKTHDAVMQKIDETKTMASQPEIIDTLLSSFDSMKKMFELTGYKIVSPQGGEPMPEEVKKKGFFPRFRPRKKKATKNAEQAGLERTSSITSTASLDTLASQISLTEQNVLTTITDNCETVKESITELGDRFQFVLEMLRTKQLEQRLQEEQPKFDLAELREKFEQNLATAVAAMNNESAQRFSELKEKLSQEEIKKQIEDTEKVLLGDNAKLESELKNNISKSIEHALQQVQIRAHSEIRLDATSERKASGSGVNLQQITPTLAEKISRTADIGIQTLQTEWPVVQSPSRTVSDQVTKEHDSPVESVLENLAKGQKSLLERTEKMSELMPQILTQIDGHKVQLPELLKGCTETNLIDNMKKFEESVSKLSEQIRGMEQEEGSIKIALEQLSRMISDEIKSGLAATGEKNTEITESQKEVLEQVERFPDFVVSKLQEIESEKADKTKKGEEVLVDAVRRVIEHNQSQSMVQLSEQISSVVDKIKEALPDDQMENILNAIAKGQQRVLEKIDQVTSSEKVLIDTQSLISGGIKTELENHKMVQESLEKLAALIPQEGRTIRAQLGDERGTLLQEMQANEQKRANGVLKLTDSMEACRPPPFPIAQLSGATSQLVIEANQKAIDLLAGRTNQNLEQLTAKVTQVLTMGDQLEDQKKQLLQEMRANEQKRKMGIQWLNESVAACRQPPFPIAQLSRATSELVIEANERAIDSWVGRTNQNLEQLTAKVTQMSGGDAPITKNLKKLAANVITVLTENKDFKLSFFDPSKKSMTLGFSHEFRVSEFGSYDTDIHYDSPVVSITHDNVTRKFKLTVKPKDSRDGMTDFLGVYLWYVDGPEETLKLNSELICLTEDGQKSIIKIDNREFKRGSGWGCTMNLPRSLTALAEQGYLTLNNTILHVFAQLEFNL